MSGNSIILDTNIALYLLKGDSVIKDFLRDKIFFLSFINELELLSYPSIKSEEIIYIEYFLTECTILEYSKNIKDLTITIRKKYKLKLPDAIIAATAIFFNMPLISADNHFEKINELILIKFQP
jgi:predicted nucleic acid-binding protein